MRKRISADGVVSRLIFPPSYSRIVYYHSASVCSLLSSTSLVHGGTRSFRIMPTSIDVAPLKRNRCLLQSVSPPSFSDTKKENPLPVSSAIVHFIRSLLQLQPKEKWIPIGELYNSIPSEMRRKYVRPHKTLRNLLERIKSEKLLPSLNLVLDDSGLYVAVGGVPPTSPGSSIVAAAEPTVRGQVLKVKEKHPLSTYDEEEGRGEASCKIPPVDFYFDVGLSEYPPPPEAFDVVVGTLPSPQSSADGAVLSLHDFVHFIPPFFVPVDKVLEHMPGYTVDHLEEYLLTHAVEMVRLGEERFIRLHGGFGKINLRDCDQVKETFAFYRPDPQLAPAFVKAFGGEVGRWVSLPSLLERTDPSVVDQLPWKGPLAVLYFAQMQHLFHFSVHQAGGTESSILLRPPKYGGLMETTTPTPEVVSYFFFAIDGEAQLDVESLKPAMPDTIKEMVEQYYGNLESFFDAHAPLFYLTEDRSVVMRTALRRRLHLASLSLEEQLQIALEKRDKAKIRTLRRRIAFRDNPSHPFHDPDNLAAEVAKYLPKKGFTLLKMFMRTLPEEILYYMPKRHYAFFTAYPQFFQLFEYRQAGSWALSRPGQPLPRGVLRQDFDEEDVIRLIAEQLQFRHGKAACSTIIVNLPKGAQEYLKKRHGALYYLVEKYPAFFRVVLPSDNHNVISAAVIHLIEVPSFEKQTQEEREAPRQGDDDEEE